MQPGKLAVVLAILLFASVVQAHMYRYTDSEGHVHYTDSPPSSTHVERIEGNISVYQAPGVASSSAQPTNSAKAQSVVIYSASWCGVCAKAKRYMQQHNIAYTDYDIETSAKGKRDYARMNGNGVPILMVGGKRMDGFSAGRLEAMLRPN